MGEYKDRLLALNYELRDLEKKEKTLFLEDSFWKKAAGKYTATWRDNLEEKIPDKLEETLRKAFVGAFKAVFRGGKTLIDKTYDSEALEAEHRAMLDDIAEKGDRSLLKKLRRSGGKRHLKAMGVATTEGVGLGLLGIGIPDVPILIANLIRLCTMSAKSHGVDVDCEAEQLYMLLLIELVAEPTEAREAVNEKLNQLSKAIDQGEHVHMNLSEQMTKTAEALATAMLFSHFVMGLPIIGVAGGLYNTVIVSQLHQLAEIKYQMRLLNRCKADIVRAYHSVKGENKSL
ncbi:MAG: EcsC family protein [Peptococcaceae bacterium]|jgi:hypothetical protein|nr:EcsC family protein [Peptococcaceae bacterium]